MENDIEERTVKEIRKAMSNKELQPCGACHWCNDYVRGNSLFCCKECEDDYNRAKRQDQ
jgi:hypothetical protein